MSALCEDVSACRFQSAFVIEDLQWPTVQYIAAGS